MATLKPTTPLLASNKGALKPASPLLTPNKGPLKPASPLRPKNAPKTPISHPQRRWRFQTRLGRRPQRRWRFQTTGPAGLQGLAAVPVGAGRAWPGFETTRRAKLAARACHRPPAHTAAGASGARNTRGYTQQPGPAGHAQQPAPAAGPSGARNTRGHTKPPGPTGAGRLSQFRKLSAESRQCRGLRGRSPGGRWKYRAWKQRPSRFPPCGGPRRRRWRSAWPSRRRSRRRCLRSRPG